MVAVARVLPATRFGFGRAYERLTGRRTVLVLGDSHARVFLEVNRLRLLPRTRFVVVAVSGATALGAVNPNSMTNALGTFRQVLRWTRRQTPLVCVLGEVDCGYLVWYRSESLGVPLATQVTESITNYLRFLREDCGPGRPILVVSPPPPTISDDFEWTSEIANLRKSVQATQLERTALTVEYARRLGDQLRDLPGSTFMDLNSDVIDPATMLVRRSLVNKDPQNHHLNQQEYARIIAHHMTDALYG